ncbi:acid phosphatase type 7 isoform X2 [Octopus bimaculoides]|uniref:Purple acid phosphatase n=1 Tax=Octopus bimaculoides TaxID=37653 RepID=A0A0L8GF81_OCTBM|nr:acid phosphatase type 7 isoform X2 [Octopus bimaculoides]|eukprot:XP_014781554.1 PREDICTED: iron/zinc purple acid phosphatase-like protein isoform X1 [Octopus bimaculoides]
MEISGLNECRRFAILLLTFYNVLLLCSTTPIYNGYPTTKFNPYLPEQIHIAYGEDYSMIITWSTFKSGLNTIVKYGTDSLSHVAYGKAQRFINPDLYFHTQYIHVVTVPNLQPGVKYIYRCGSPQGWSEQFSFTAKRNDSSWAPMIALFGDMGSVNAQSLPRLLKEVKQNLYDSIFHVGDFAYDMHKGHGEVGDKFMQLIQPMAANVPYMTCPGNHEAYANFSNYKNRFHMPGDIDSDNMFFSFDIGPAHVISFSTEYYFFIEYGLYQIEHQYHWLEADLKKANEPANRAKRPWIITMAHRPMYCSNNDKDDCTKSESLVRKGVPIIHAYGLEDLFYKYGVDLEIWAHEHSYERLLPIYDRHIYNTSSINPYDNPEAPVHITTGSAGCSEKHDPFANKTAPWSVFRSLDYGYTRMKIYNSSHLYTEQVSDDKDGEVIDKMWLIKDTHGPYKDKTLRYNAKNEEALKRMESVNRKSIFANQKKMSFRTIER